MKTRDTSVGAGHARDELFETVAHALMGHPETMKTTVPGWPGPSLRYGSALYALCAVMRTLADLGSRA